MKEEKKERDSLNEEKEKRAKTPEVQEPEEK